MHHEPYDTGPRHHLFFPKKWYRTELEKRFRELPCCVVPISPFIHALKHACMDDRPPSKPSETCMLQSVNNYYAGVCGCTHHAPLRLPVEVADLTSYRERRVDGA